MAKGADSKEKVKQQILEMFNGSFINDKEIRIPMVENGEQIEIKIVITCAKEVIGGGQAIAVPEATVTAFPISQAPAKVEVTQEEKERLKNLLAQMF